MNVTPPLLDLLGTHWDVKAAVVGVAWDANTRTAACATADGMLVLADGVWPNGPHLAPRPAGGWAVVAGTSPAPEPLRVRAHPKASMALCSDRLGGFLSGGAEGRLVHVSATGSCSQLAKVTDAAISAVASGHAGVRAWAAGQRLHRIHLQREAQIELPSMASAIAFDNGGLQLAACHDGGVTLWPAAEGDAPTRLSWPGAHSALAWHPDASVLVSGTQGNVLHAWRIADGSDIELSGNPGAPHSLAFAGDGRFLVASGGTRPVAWRFDPPRAGEPAELCGAASKAAVTQVACHPTQALIAAGHHNGAIALSQPGQADVLVVRAAGSGPVTALAWSPDGTRLAFGTQDRCFGWLHLPADLFRFTTP